jgi:hypothetical protein
VTVCLSHFNAGRPHRSLGGSPAQVETGPPEPINLADYEAHCRPILDGISRRLSVDRTTLAIISVDDLLGCLGLSSAERLDLCRRAVTTTPGGGDEHRQRGRVLRQALGRLGSADATPAGLLAGRRAALAQRSTCSTPCNPQAGSAVRVLSSVAATYTCT